MKFRNVPLSYIKEEEAFRSDLEDFGLTTDIQETELNKPLIVEKIETNQFVLVEGYRRFRALKDLNTPSVMCQVENLTSPDARVLKRLRTELKIKKRTSDEIERMITFLLDAGYHEDEIAKQCTVEKKTIKKYMSGRNMKKSTKLDPFDERSKEKEKECMDEMIDNNHSIDMAVKDTVFTKALKYKYSPIMHKHVFEGLLYLLDKIDDMAHSNLVDYLSSSQKKTLQQKLISLSRKLDLPLYWLDHSFIPANSIDKPKKVQKDMQMLYIDDLPENQSDINSPHEPLHQNL
ncbi:ParB/Srx family N-terminal domain-containing protein [Domibacillus robiginosus]|uniref:ParB/Srx family N-terminal domain-containing protein n=1 Tax=Domibacillus robiginosus TaxID=1071054 RepID=UPI00067E5BC8|nr:ParB/Srx family N-terminal domain-containing protein [Domibacillus robiginosus]